MEYSVSTLVITEDDLYDEWCDPKKPRVLRFEEIAAAAYRIKYGVQKTPCTVGCSLARVNRLIVFLSVI